MAQSAGGSMKQETPSSMRLHIGIFGKTNAGKSSLLNAITSQSYSIVSDIKGTTADPVRKPMELHGVGPVLFIDTAGFCDESELGHARIGKTLEALASCDIVLALFAADDCDTSWIEGIRGRLAGKAVIGVITKSDAAPRADIAPLSDEIKAVLGETPVAVSAVTKDGIPELLQKIREKAAPPDASFTRGLCARGDCVLLVMPQDIQAPKGRLILPQVQVLRELLDKGCIVLSCTADCIESALGALAEPPHLIITDSQVFKKVRDAKPTESLLTSFSVLMAAEKGDIASFLEGAEHIKNITDASRILIAEACTHVPLAEDIGRVKIPAMIRKTHPGVTIDFVRGKDFPPLTSEGGERRYDLIIHCGACMFNRTYMLHRQRLAREAGVPMTNYGIAIAALSGILDDVSIP